MKIPNLNFLAMPPFYHTQLYYQLIFVLTIISNPKQPICKKKCVALKKAIVKKEVKSKVAAKKGCDGRLMAKKFNYNNSGEFDTKS